MTAAVPAIAGVRIVERTGAADERGSFETLVRGDVMAEAGLAAPAQVALSRNVHRHVLRGLHLQAATAPQVKLVACVRGRVHDVLVDVRRSSATFGRWFGIDLSEDGPSLLVPAGCAHGFLTLSDQADVLYALSAPAAPAAERGIRWDDPAVGVEWPVLPQLTSERDRSWPAFGASSFD